jgi:AraC family transcriptional regulator of adaptative response / DNA-3-methyladenine glycosylase II
LVAKGPGRRVPRTVDEDELAIRAVLGQQISTAAARTLAGRLAAEFGVGIADAEGGLRVGFPAAEALADVDPAALPMPGARARCVVAMAAALAEGRIDLSPGADWDQARVALRAVAGVGPWTREIVAMRALGDPDAFPAGDMGVRKAVAELGLSGVGGPGGPDARWRPWRAYAVQHLWAALDHPINHWPPKTGAGKDRT